MSSAENKAMSGMHMPTGENMWAYPADDDYSADEEDGKEAKINKSALGLTSIPAEQQNDYNFDQPTHTKDPDNVGITDVDSDADIGAVNYTKDNIKKRDKMSKIISELSNELKKRGYDFSEILKVAQDQDDDAIRELYDANFRESEPQDQDDAAIRELYDTNFVEQEYMSEFEGLVESLSELLASQQMFAVDAQELLLKKNSPDFFTVLQQTYHKLMTANRSGGVSTKVNQAVRAQAIKLISLLENFKYKKTGSRKGQSKILKVAYTDTDEHLQHRYTDSFDAKSTKEQSPKVTSTGSSEQPAANSTHLQDSPQEKYLKKVQSLRAAVAAIGLTNEDLKNIYSHIQQLYMHHEKSSQERDAAISQISDILSGILHHNTASQNAVALVKDISALSKTLAAYEYSKLQFPNGDQTSNSQSASGGENIPKSKYEYGWPGFLNGGDDHKLFAASWQREPAPGYTKDYNSFVKWYNSKKSAIGREIGAKECSELLKRDLTNARVTAPAVPANPNATPQQTAPQQTPAAQAPVIAASRENIMMALARLLRGMPLRAQDGENNMIESNKVSRMTKRYLRGIASDMTLSSDEDKKKALGLAATLVSQVNIDGAMFADKVSERLKNIPAANAQQAFDGLVWQYLQKAWSEYGSLRGKEVRDSQQDRRWNRIQRQQDNRFNRAS